MSQGNRTPQSLGDQDPNLHPSRLTLLQQPLKQSTDTKNIKEMSYAAENLTGANLESVGMWIKGRAEGTREIITYQMDDYGQDNMNATNADSKNKTNVSGYAERDDRADPAGYAATNSHVGRNTYDRNGTNIASRRTEQRDTYHSGRYTSAYREGRREKSRYDSSSSHDHRRNDRNQTRDDYQSYRNREQDGQQSHYDERDRDHGNRRVHPQAQRRSRSRELFPNHYRRRSRSPRPETRYNDYRDTPQNTRNYQSQQSGSRAGQQSSSQGYQQQHHQGPGNWWSNDLSVEANYARGWSMVPREYRVFIRDTVSIGYRIVNDPVWKLEFSPAENMRYFLTTIPEAFREGFGEYLATIEEREFNRR